MKKALILLMAILLLNLSISESCKNDNASKAEDCEKLEAGEGFYKCCYYETDWKSSEGKGTKKGCEPITKDQYDNIKDYIKKIENGDFDDDEDSDVELDVSVDCGSDFIVFSLLALILLFL